MSSAKITMIGCERALEVNNESLFDYLQLPSGIDKDTLVAELLVRSGEFEVLYPDPYMIRDLIGFWSKKHYPTFDKWIKALNVEYNPLDNYDRHEEITEEHEGTFKGNTSSSNSSVGNSKSKVENDDTTTNTGDTTGYNSSDFVDNDQNVTVLDGEQNSSSEYADTTTGKGSQDNKDAYKNKHTSHLWGNIGVTTSAQMLQGELDVRRFNIYSQIADIFVSEFCILVY